MTALMSYNIKIRNHSVDVKRGKKRHTMRHKINLFILN